jgi:hypothetical protein
MTQRIQFGSQSSTEFSQLGSSETIREVSFDFELYVQHGVLHKKSVNLKNLEWLIGFTEGDGSFIVSKNRNFFILTQKSYKTLCKVKKILGFGSVSKAGNYFRYIVADQQGVFKLICLFNGNLILNKTKERFKRWLLNYNQYANTNICYKSGSKLTNYHNNGWLSGFIDAEGCFYALYRKDRLLSIRLSLFIDQKGEKDILENIAKDFEGDVVKRLISQTSDLPSLSEVEYPMFRISIASTMGRNKLVRYIQQYNLLGDKHISYLRWKRIHDLIPVYKTKSREKTTYLNGDQNAVMNLNLVKLANLCKKINKR